MTVCRGSNDYVGFGTWATYVVERKLISSLVGYPTMGFVSISAVSGSIQLLSVVNTTNRMTAFLFLIARKQLVCSLTCESGDPTRTTYYVNGF
jgi:hypothetical protein